MNKFFGELITKYNKSGETPYKLNLYNSKAIPDYKGSTSYYRYNITINGNEKERFNYAYVIYYYSDPGGVFIPHCCFTNETEADNFIKYWNDDNGIMATGRYYFKKKVEVL
jgi:hypothetical protein